MKRFHLVVATVVLLSGCSRTEKTENTSENIDSVTTEVADSIAIDYDALESYLYSKPVDSSDVEVIDYDCAVLVYPTEEQIVSIKKEYGEDDFYTIADDYQFYQGMAIGEIDSAGVKTLSVDKRFFRFRGKGQEWTIDVRKEKFPAWNIFFFQVDKKPKRVQAINVTSVDSVKVYFNR